MFDEVWMDLAEDGLVDDFAGAEYQRVYAEWIAAGCPSPITAFVLWRANTPPELM